MAGYIPKDDCEIEGYINDMVSTLSRSDQFLTVGAWEAFNALDDGSQDELYQAATDLGLKHGLALSVAIDFSEAVVEQTFERIAQDRSRSRRRGRR